MTTLKPTRPQPACPECEKLAAVSEESNKIGAFLDWLQEEHETVLSYFSGDGNLYAHTMYSGDNGINRLLAEYFEIDLDKVERERCALLEWLQEQHEQRG